MKDQVISLDLARRLKELGLEQEASYWWIADVDDWTNAELVGVNWTDYSYRDCRKVAAFTVAELGEMLPKYLSIGEVGEREFRYLTITHSDGVVQRLGRWYVYYDLPSHVGKDYRYGMEADTEAEARGLMLAYLIENKLMPL